MVDTLAPNTPHALALDWWRRLERAIDYYFVAYHGRRRPVFREYLEEFRNHPGIGEAFASEIDGLRIRRNHIAHGDGEPLTPAEAATFAERSLDLLWKIARAVPNERSNEP